jgi:ribosomal protein L11 methyltransferase
LSSPEAWVEVRVIVPLGWQELVADNLALEPCTSAAFGRPNLGVKRAPEGSEYVRFFFRQADDSEGLRAELQERLAKLLRLVQEPELEGLELTFKLLPPEDYATSWEKSWKPFRVGPLCLLPPWDERSLASHEKRLTIQPGGSFGSGRHATTRTCLRTLTRRLRGGERVLDAGAGSGILSVSSALLGAQSCLGFDIAANSAAASRQLARDNGVLDRCSFRSGGFEVLREDELDFDVVLANIYSDVIQLHAEDLAARLAPNGWFAFSGCPDQHHAPTLAAIEAAGLVVEEPLQRGRWHTFVGRHR